MNTTANTLGSERRLSRLPAARMATALLIALAAGPAAAQSWQLSSPDCAVDYTVTDTWSGGFNAEVVVTHRRSSALDGWTSTWSFANGERITSSWRSGLASAGPTADLRHMDYNRAVPGGGRVDFGFSANGVPKRPSGFRFNGLSCDAAITETPEAGVDHGTLVLNEHFGNRTSTTWQPYTLNMVLADFGTLGGHAIRGFDGGTVDYQADNRVGNGILRAHYPRNRAGGDNTGFIFDKFFQAANEATFEYRVRFEGVGSPSAFYWAAGGKLPGLGGTTVGTPPAGCTSNLNSIDNGFSTRLMWRSNGRLVVYTYFPDRDITKCGVDYTFFENAQPNRWYTIRQHLRMNTPGQRDGLLEMYVDGTRTLRLTNVLYRKSGKSGVRVNNVMFHTYRGGKPDDTRFHSPVDNRIQFDDFKVWVR